MKKLLLYPLMALCLLAFVRAAQTRAEPLNPQLFSGMHWRLIGPFRGGRVLAVSGVPNDPEHFYFGAVDGGVWQTTNAGRVWKPIFDKQPIASIGALAVAPSQTGILYAGSGEADMRSDITYGNGVYKSTDGGATWAHTGLEDTRHIGRIIVDPRNPEVVFVAALGHAYGPNTERGVFRSRDGGRTWRRVLFKDENTGAIDLAFDSHSARIVYASLWQTRRPPWSIYPPSNGPGSGLYKSTDGGDTWRELTSRGLPKDGLGKIGIAVAPTRSNRLYAIVDAKDGGLYRSDDSGETWQPIDKEKRIWNRGWYFCEITVDPKDAETVYVSNTSLYRSTDGGNSFTAIKGAPGGDDYHRLWIDPANPQRMILASDQGAIVSLDGARSWSSWYNQPTAQFYHVSTDNRFPYWVYGAQQDSGSIAIPSRSTRAGISAHDWFPIDVGGESQYIAPDPIHSNTLFGGTFGSVVTRYDLTTHQTQEITPHLAYAGRWRETWTLPLAFSSADPSALYFGQQRLFRTRDRGNSWQLISPDLSRPDPGVPPSLDAPTIADNDGAKRRGVIYSIAPSPVRAKRIWVGTDDGLIHLTNNHGATWRNVTPKGLLPWSKVGVIEASRHDVATAYVAVDRHRLEDLTPYVYRTRDSGKSWQLLTRGIPLGSYVNVVREDPVRKGLLYAGTETGMFVSFDDGADWQPLQLNLPVASIRDISIHGHDVVVATHGRSFWILDDVAPLREITVQPSGPAFLYKPVEAIRIRPGSDEGTPLPPEVAVGENPPNGAIIDYYVNGDSNTPLTITVRDSDGKLVRRYSSSDRAESIDPTKLDIPSFWIRPQLLPSSEKGMHRYVWDLHYAGQEKGIIGPWAPPGQYTVALSFGGGSYVRPLLVKKDPRISASDADLRKQFEIARQLDEQRSRVSLAQRDAVTVQPKDSILKNKAKGFVQRLDVLSQTLSAVQGAVESADAAPTADVVKAFRAALLSAAKELEAWNRFKKERVNGAAPPRTQRSAAP